MVGLPLPGTAAPATSTDPCTQGPRSLWVDRTHDWLSRGLCWPSRWVDGFFADPLSTSNEPAARLVRITGERTWRDDGLDDRDLDVDARVWLPSAERRLSLLFRSNEDDTVADGPQASEVTGIGEDDSGAGAHGDPERSPRAPRRVSARSCPTASLTEARSRSTLESPTRAFRKAAARASCRAAGGRSG